MTGYMYILIVGTSSTHRWVRGILKETILVRQVHIRVYWIEVRYMTLMFLLNLCKREILFAGSFPNFGPFKFRPWWAWSMHLFSHLTSLLTLLLYGVCFTVGLSVSFLVFKDNKTRTNICLYVLSNMWLYLNSGFWGWLESQPQNAEFCR